MEVSSPRGDGSKGTQLYCIAVFFVYFYIFEYCLLPPNQLTVSYLYNFCYLFIWYFSILFVLTCIEPKRISETTKDYMRSTHRTQESVIQQPTLLKGKYSKCIVWFWYFCICWLDCSSFVLSAKLYQHSSWTHKLIYFETYSPSFHIYVVIWKNTSWRDCSGWSVCTIITSTESSLMRWDLVRYIRYLSNSHHFYSVWVSVVPKGSHTQGNNYACSP